MDRIFLKEWRKKSNLSQIKLAEIMEVDGTTIGRWEKNIVPLTSKQIAKLCSIFKISIPQIYAAPEDAETVARLEVAYRIVKNLDESDLNAWLKIGERLASSDREGADHDI